MSRTLEEMERIGKILTEELAEEGGHVLAIGGHEREGHVIVKGDLYSGETLTSRGLVMIKTEYYQRITQLRPVTCAECGHAFHVARNLERFQCPKCKKELQLDLSEEDKKFEEFEPWSIGLAFWSKEKSVGEKVKEVFEGIPKTLREKPETVIGSSGLITLILRFFGVGI